MISLCSLTTLQSYVSTKNYVGLRPYWPLTLHKNGLVCVNETCFGNNMVPKGKDLKLWEIKDQELLHPFSEDKEKTEFYPFKDVWNLNASQSQDMMFSHYLNDAWKCTTHNAPSSHTDLEKCIIKVKLFLTNSFISISTIGAT